MCIVLTMSFYMRIIIIFRYSKIADDINIFLISCLKYIENGIVWLEEIFPLNGVLFSLTRCAQKFISITHARYLFIIDQQFVYCSFHMTPKLIIARERENYSLSWVQCIHCKFNSMENSINFINNRFISHTIVNQFNKIITGKLTIMP